MAKKIKIAYSENFSLDGEQLFVKLVHCDGYTDRLIKGNLQGARPDFALAQIALLQRCIHELVQNGTKVNLEPSTKGKSEFPRIWDAEARESLTDRLLKLIVAHVEPQLADQYPDCFGEYGEEEGEEEYHPPTQAQPTTYETSQPSPAIVGAGSDTAVYEHPSE